MPDAADPADVADVRARIVAIIAAQALVDPGEVRDEATMADLGIDSMGLVECIYGIEEALGMAIPFNANVPGAEGLDVSSVGAVVRSVARLSRA